MANDAIQWIAPSGKDSTNGTPEKHLWEAADQLRANSGLTAAQYSQPVLGLIFLRFAEVRFARQRATLEGIGAPSRRGARTDDPAAYHAEGVLYLTPTARYDHLLALPEAADAGKAVNDTMRDVERDNPQLAGVLPKTYNLFNSTLLKELLKTVSAIPASVENDAFGRIYEYFLGEFARTKGQKGGEFYTPACLVRLLTEVIEPYHGRILDPARGSGGMFVSSARFVAEHRNNPEAELSIYGVEKTDDTGRLCRMNLAVHGLEGDILTRPAPELSSEERDAVKKVAKQLLERLNDLLVLDWRKRQTSRARVETAISDVLDAGLPNVYTRDLYNQKVSTVFEHVYESHATGGHSGYASPSA